MVCRPSASRRTCSGLLPWTMFQYWDGTTGILLMRKYWLSRSNVAVVPARRALHTAAAGLKARRLEAA